MLVALSIKNYALIENLSVNFKDKLSIITGETGAGKSVLLGALGLVLGKRSDSTSLKDADKKCIIEAQFSVNNYGLERFFEENDLDFEKETILRREILPSGKSRAFINDTPTTLNVLQSLSEQLIDIHSQHQTLQLADVNFQFHILDALAKNTAKLTSYSKGLKLYHQLKKELEILKLNQEKSQQNFEYNSHLYQELVQAKLELGEQEEIEQELDKLNNIEAIKLNLSEAQNNTFIDEIGLISRLNSVTSNLEKISLYSEEYKKLYDRILSIKIEFDDISNELVYLNESVNFEPSELDKLNNRLQLIYNLQQKHTVKTIAELLEIQLKLEKEVNVAENSSTIISEKENEIKIVAKKLDNLAKLISDARQKAIPVFIKKIDNLLANLGMENTRLKWNLSHVNQYFSNGKDELQLLISANKGLNFGTLQKIASGGELSRIMLSVKSILSEYLKLPTIIFDEIDAGVSGTISQKVATIMLEMSENMQVIAITHLPQIAAKGNQHYKVFKQDVDNQIITQLKRLTKEERIIEIAEMLSGKNTTTTAIEHAKQLLN
ncbi:DNA repair protein RecN [Lutibacter sp.]|uniref:DNA repair protein RecN n=1 Tax=Lutibacter sp. TaxID=1925666 RepID=UPI0025C6C7F9|nr:DNA repair protein RecN [Lutibacter sp.]MCF6180947.1 DNA repair protein RecN [Lutibacter sp.]